MNVGANGCSPYVETRFIASHSKKFPLLKRLKKISQPLSTGSWPVDVVTSEGERITGRLCVIRKTPDAIAKAHKKLKRKASKNGHRLQAQTLFVSEYVILFTTFPRKKFSTEKILEWYRIRWQIELVFKRFKQITHMGHLPKYHDDSAQAWMYGKLLVALLTEKIMAHAKAISPWGTVSTSQPLAQLPVYVPPNPTSHPPSVIFR